MSPAAREAPLHHDVVALAGVLLEELETGRSFPGLRRRLADGALRLVDAVTLAVAGFDRADRLDAADAELRTLRTHIGLALDLGVVPEGLFLALAEQIDLVGRQIGGWLRALERVR